MFLLYFILSFILALSYLFLEECCQGYVIFVRRRHQFWLCAFSLCSFLYLIDPFVVFLQVSLLV